MWSSKFAMHCCSYWMASLSYSTCYMTRSSTFIYNTVTERSAMLTSSFTLRCSVRKCSFPCCICDFSSLNFAWREFFSCYIVLHCSMSMPCTCFNSWVIFLFLLVLIERELQLYQLVSGVGLDHLPTLVLPMAGV
jgi:hypothetical protein